MKKILNFATKPVVMGSALAAVGCFACPDLFAKTTNTEMGKLVTDMEEVMKGGPFRLGVVGGVGGAVLYSIFKQNVWPASCAAIVVAGAKLIDGFVTSTWSATI